MLASALSVAALSLAGCATDEEVRREAYARDAQARAAVAQSRPRPQELEDDGLPSQVPPPVNRSREPDDPREPYSPNYGKSAPTPQRAAAFAPTASQPPQRRIAAN